MRFQGPRRNPDPDLAGRNALGQHCAGSHDCPVSDDDSLKDHAPGSNPDIPAQKNRFRFDGLPVHGLAGNPVVIRVGKCAAGGDQTIIADIEAITNVELTPPADENPVANDDRWTGSPIVVEIEKYVGLQDAPVPQLYLMWPGKEGSGRNQGPAPDLCSTHLEESHPRHAGNAIEKNGAPPQPLDHFSGIHGNLESTSMAA